MMTCIVHDKRAASPITSPQCRELDRRFDCPAVKRDERMLRETRIMVQEEHALMKE